MALVCNHLVPGVGRAVKRTGHKWGRAGGCREVELEVTRQTPPGGGAGLVLRGAGVPAQQLECAGRAAGAHLHHRHPGVPGLRQRHQDIGHAQGAAAAEDPAPTQVSPQPRLFCRDASNSQHFHNGVRAPLAPASACDPHREPCHHSAEILALVVSCLLHFPLGDTPHVAYCSGLLGPSLLQGTG